MLDQIRSDRPVGAFFGDEQPCGEVKGKAGPAHHGQHDEHDAHDRRVHVRGKRRSPPLVPVSIAAFAGPEQGLGRWVCFREILSIQGSWLAS